MCKHSRRRSRRPHSRNFIRSAEHAPRGKEPNYRAIVDSELPPYAGGRPCLQGSTRSFPGAGGRARATYSCLPQLLTSSRSFLGSSAERRRGNRLSCGPAPRHRQGRPLAEQLGSLARAPPATAARCRSPPYRPAGCRTWSRPAARANRERAFRRRTGSHLGGIGVEFQHVRCSVIARVLRGSARLRGLFQWRRQPLPQHARKLPRLEAHRFRARAA